MDYISNDTIKMPLLGLGTYTMHGDQLKDAVAIALQLGYSLFDTATKYCNEEDLGVAVKGAPNIILQSKVHDSQLRGNLRYLRLNKKNVKKSFYISKDKLEQAPSVYFLHSPFDGYERHYSELGRLRERGKVKAIGICNVEVDQLKNLIKTTGVKPDVVQAEIHPYHSNKQLINYCKAQDILVEARSPLAHGDVIQEWLSNDIMKRVAASYNKTVVQVVLRWITQQGVVAIVRSKNRRHLKDNINIFDFDLAQRDMDDIDMMNKNLSFGFVSSKVFE